MADKNNTYISEFENGATVDEILSRAAPGGAIDKSLANRAPGVLVNEYAVATAANTLDAVCAAQFAKTGSNAMRIFHVNVAASGLGLAPAGIWNMTVYKSTDSYGRIDGRFIYNGITCTVTRQILDGVLGPWEWFNPPMLLGVEYRTTERYFGRPVYCKLVNIPSVTANVPVAIEYSEDTNCRPISAIGGGWSGGAMQTGLFAPSPTESAIGTVHNLKFGATLNYVTAEVDFTSTNLCVTVKYYKTTD